MPHLTLSPRQHDQREQASRKASAVRHAVHQALRVAIDRRDAVHAVQTSAAAARVAYPAQWHQDCADEVDYLTSQIARLTRMARLADLV